MSDPLSHLKTFMKGVILIGYYSKDDNCTGHPQFLPTYVYPIHGSERFGVIDLPAAVQL